MPSAIHDGPAPITTTTRAALEATPATPAPPEPRPASTEPRPAPAAAARDGETCIEVDSDLGGKHITLEGRVVVDAAFEHPTRGKTHPYILRLDASRCAIGIDDARIRELHLAPSEDVSLAPLVGKHVRVSGDPFTAHTAWHARPIVLMTTTATLLPSR